jgi:hypothetical protein
MEKPPVIRLERLGLLATADFVALGAVHPGGQEFEVGDHVIHLRTDGAGNDVVNGELRLLTIAEASALRVQPIHGEPG